MAATSCRSPRSLHGGDGGMVGVLIFCGLISETRADSQTRVESALSRIWNNNEGAHHPPAHRLREGRRKGAFPVSAVDVAHPDEFHDAVPCGAAILAW